MSTISDTSSTVKVWEKRVIDIANQTNLNATDIGALQNNRGRLNFVAKLDEKDKEDLLKVTVHTSGKLSLNLDTDASLRVQIMRQNGSRVIADSNPDAGAAFDTFSAMSGGTYDMEPGTYLVKVAFAKEETPKPIDYALQMKLGTTYPNDYVTWESQASTKPEIPQPQMSPITNIFSGFMKSLREMFSY